MREKQSLLINYTSPRQEYQKGREFSLSSWRKKVLARDKYRCKNCGNSIVDSYRKKVPNLEAHYIVPRKHGGRNTLKNGITLCSFCHGYISYIYDRHGIDFKQLSKEKPKTARIQEAKNSLKYTYLRYLRKIIKYF